MRMDGRQPGDLRPVVITTEYVSYPEGSVLISLGGTRVLCNATIEDGVPRWMQNQNRTGGWITGEYAMLPRATHQRTARETNGLSGRTQEIRRLIGRSLRAAVNLEKLGPRTCIIDCDVIQADGGTRTAAITGGYLALGIAVNRLIHQDLIPPDTVAARVAAVSVGVVGGIAMLDLCYAEDSKAEVDANIVMNDRGEFIEVQTTAEGAAYPRSRLEELLDLAEKGIGELFSIQKQVMLES